MPCSRSLPGSAAFAPRRCWSRRSTSLPAAAPDRDPSRALPAPAERPPPRGRPAPEQLGGEAGEAHRLSELLGDDHDLSFPSGAVVDVSAGIPAGVEGVRGLIQYRRNELQTDAFFLGERLYAESPKAFARRL